MVTFLVLKVIGLKLEAVASTLELGSISVSPVKISMNTGNSERAFDLQRLQNVGIGLAWIEFIIERMIGFVSKPNSIIQIFHNKSSRDVFILILRLFENFAKHAR